MMKGVMETNQLHVIDINWGALNMHLYTPIIICVCVCVCAGVCQVPLNLSLHAQVCILNQLYAIDAPERHVRTCR